MITATPLTGGAIPHEDNIKAIHASIPDLAELDRLGAIYAGGYPMALMFAPRCTHGDKIRGGFYHDHDIYFENKAHADAAIAFLENQPHRFTKVSDTANANSYKLIREDPAQQDLAIQIVKKVYGDAEAIIKRFDFVNCAMAYQPSQNMMYWHEAAIEKHLASELEILDPWMLDEPENRDHMLIQLSRFRKYTIRWDYLLSDAAFTRLLGIYLEMPDLQLTKNVAVMAKSGDNEYAERVFIGQKDDNVWEAIADVFRSHRFWSDDLDPHGRISAGQPTPDALLEAIAGTQMDISPDLYTMFEDGSEMFF